ncbi:MAG: sulfite exporter TauE/SafE family protein [Deltaproteobacteria bacterium]|nr:sulfite exporter TauE/SafE family protein [Deltaproteobacteria bacterium]
MSQLIEIIDNPYGPTAFFILGLVSSLHCVCMCGPISVLFFQQGQNRLNPMILYHGSRLISYTWLGWFFGVLHFSMPSPRLQKAFLILILLLLMLFALGKTKWLTQVLYRVQAPLMKYSQKFSPTTRSVLLGFFSPLLPCAPLYAALSSSLLASTPILSGIWMMMFSLGTIPLLFLQQSGIKSLASKLSKIPQGYFFRWLAWVLISILLYMHFM